MRRATLVSVLLVILIAAISPSQGAKCRGRYMEMRGGDGFVTRGGCRGLDSQIQEEYWSTVGFDGALRDGRTTDDFLQFPEQDNQGHRMRNSFVGYWITRSKYGENVHYEAFGHAFIKPDGKVCGWFIGSEKEVVEVCGGFRVLSRSRHQPHQELPFEWVQGPQYRNRDVLGFHSHKIAKYEVNGDEIVFGDADVKSKKFNGVSISNEQRLEVDQPDQFHRKVWLLRKKSLQQPPQEIRRPVVTEQKRREDLDIYKDPHHEERIKNWRLYPYYDQYGRPSASQTDSARPAYDSSGRRIPFDESSSQYSQYYQNSQEIRRPSQDTQSSQNSQISHNYQYYDSQQQPPRNHPGYEEWLRNQYRIRGIIPKGYEGYFAQNSANDGQDYGRSGQYGANGRDSGSQRTSGNDALPQRYGGSEDSNIGRGVSVVDGNGQVVNSQNQYEQPAYILQPSSGNTENNGNHQVVYEGDSGNGSGTSGSSDDGKTYYSVNPGEPVDTSATQTKVENGDFPVFKGDKENGGSDDSKNVVIPKNEDSQQHVRFIRYHPPTVIRDKKGNLYERRVENGKVHYIDASGNEVKAKIDDSAIDQKIERILENRRRQEEVMRNLVGPSVDESDPMSAAETGRLGSSADNFLL